MYIAPTSKQFGIREVISFCPNIPFAAFPALSTKKHDLKCCRFKSSLTMSSLKYPAFCGLTTYCCWNLYVVHSMHLDACILAGGERGIEKSYSTSSEYTER